MNKEIKIGIIGVVCIAILFFGINYLKGINMLRASNHYFVEFSDISGLPESSPVYANGFKVGTVRTIAFNYKHPGNITVGIDANRELNIPEGTEAELVTDMLGNITMKLYLNTANSKMLSPGDTIKGTVNSGLLGKATETIVPQMEKMLPKLDSILVAVNTLLNNPALAGTIQNTEKLTANLNVTATELNKLLKNDVPAITGKLNTAAENFAVISNNLKDVNYAYTFAKVDSALQNVQLLTEKLNRTDNSVGLLLNDPAFYNNMNATANNAASLLKDLQTNPKRYVHFSIFGRKNK